MPRAPRHWSGSPFRPGSGARVNVTGDGVVLHDLLGGARPHVFTAFEWDCFLDGVRNREPGLAGL
ncbi:hypothetical protein AB0442_40485 [Kitasatospora sp. NPDC085895]|uniref:hypothetical protein n=1 Tax=Kitasatospora sp. NPDC085895 TaxID=3155057 RepID=UPI0034503DBA